MGGHFLCINNLSFKTFQQRFSPYTHTHSETHTHTRTYPRTHSRKLEHTHTRAHPYSRITKTRRAERTGGKAQWRYISLINCKSPTKTVKGRRQHMINYTIFILHKISFSVSSWIKSSYTDKNTDVLRLFQSYNLCAIKCTCTLLSLLMSSFPFFLTNFLSFFLLSPFPSFFRSSSLSF